MNSDFHRFTTCLIQINMYCPHFDRSLEESISKERSDC